MQEIRCPKCGEVFQVDESGYAAIVKQVRDREFDKEIRSHEQNAVEIAVTKSQADSAKQLADLKAELERLRAEKDKALEINASGLFQKLKSTMPGEDVVKRFRALGGKLVTIGSDSHYAQRIGNGVEQCMELAKRCGFDSVALYKNREPIEIPIE